MTAFSGIAWVNLLGGGGKTVAYQGGQQTQCSPLSNIVGNHWINGNKCLFDIAPRKPWL